MNKEISLKDFRMPGEWEPQKSVWIVWPYNKSDWPELFDNIPHIICKIISCLSLNQNVNLLIKNNIDKISIKKKLKQFRCKISNIKFYSILSNRIWVRDFGPIYLINKKQNKKIFLDFKFNGWSKYSDFKKDNEVNNMISRITKIKKFEPKIKLGRNIKKIVIEGGAIDVNGRGSILLTKECLLSKVQVRNPGIKKKMYEIILSKLLNVRNFIWLNKGIKGDDTHGHIDDITRFVSPNTIMTAIERRKKDQNYDILNNNLQILRKSKNVNGRKFKIIKVPMPRPIRIKNVRVPASYLNFLICNKIVLLPLFNDVNDKLVLKIFRKFFKTRKIVGVDCSNLIWGFGAIHCMTQHEPSI